MNSERAYVTSNTGQHGRDEEQQWLRLVSSDDPVKGMVVIFVQKMCTAFHEFEPAWKAGALKAEQLPYFRERLAGRVQKVIEVMWHNGLEQVRGYAALQELLRRAQSAQSMDNLAELAEEVHAANHTISDALEA